MYEDESIFEAPVAHEAGFEANPYASHETAFEWEQPETTHHELMESGYEMSGYANPEDEADPFLGGLISGLLGEEESAYELSAEADPFFGKIAKAARGIARKIAPLAKAIAPKAVSALAGMIPGAGAVAGPLLGKLTSSLLKEAESEAGALEASLFNPEALGESMGEAGYEAIQEAALTELLAAEAAQAGSEGEAEAILAGSLPITITIMGGQRALRPVLPTLTQANARLVRVIRRQGPAGRQLLRVVPAIQRRAIAAVRGAARRGVPVTGALATRAMAASAGSMLNNPRRVQRALERNAALRVRVAPPSPRRAAVFTPGRVAPPNPRRRGW
jgi:hypothetical protein